MHAQFQNTFFPEVFSTSALFEAERSFLNEMKGMSFFLLHVEPIIHSFYPFLWNSIVNAI